MTSLRFGASEEVNFGRGSKIARVETAGDDLIVTFDGAGNGITADNFAAKLLGSTRDGKLLFGYARLPGVNYLEPALSARLPRFTKTENGFDITVEVQNFGQVASSPADLKITYAEDNQSVAVADGQVPALKPFEKTTVEMSCGPLFETGAEYTLTVTIYPDAQQPVTLEGRVMLASQ